MRDAERIFALLLPLTLKQMISEIAFNLMSRPAYGCYCVMLDVNYKLIMDVFQLIGDFLHLIAMLMLLLKILANKNVIGLSYRTQ